MKYEMNDLLDLMVEQGASDLHLSVGQPPVLRVHGAMTPIDGPVLTPADTERLMQAITPEAHLSSVRMQGGADFGLAFGEQARFRVSAFRAKGHDAWSCDLLPAEDGSEFHFQGGAILKAYYAKWDMMIAHPPCTHLAVSGARHFKNKVREQAEAT